MTGDGQISTGAIDGFRFALPIRVRWAEVDGQQIVYNPHYLMYMDCAWSAYLKDGPGLVKQPVAYTVMAKTTLEYRASARYDDLLAVGVRISRIGRTSLLADFAVDRAGERLLDAQTVYVYVGAGGSTPTPVPDDWRIAIETFEGALPTNR